MQENATIFGHNISTNGNGTVATDSKKSRNYFPSLMVKAVDKKVAESITLTKGTLWLIGVGFLCVQLLFNYGGSAISWARADQSTVQKVDQLQDTQKDFKNDVQKQFERNEKNLSEIKDEMKAMNKGYQEMREFKIKVETAQAITNQK